jgi:hypothetical protein
MIYVIGYRDYVDDDEYIINTTSRSLNWSKGLSPFFVKPIGYNCHNVENFWQYSKLYSEYADIDGNPTDEFFEWQKNGFSKKYADRYPMGKGRIPLCSYFNDKKYSYLEARKNIYMPIYAAGVIQTPAYEKLYDESKEHDDIYLLDFDGYNHNKLNMSLNDVVNNEKKKMGHAFVLKFLLVKDIKPYTILNFTNI